MALANSINRDGTRAAQPAAGPENYGCLYRVTDEGNALEQSDGATWVPISSGSVGGLKIATVTITDAQFKALPTTPLQLVAAPGAGKMLVPIRAIIMYGSGGTGYTNINASLAGLFLAYTGAAPLASSFLIDDPKLATPITDFSDMFASTGGFSWTFTWPYQNDRGSANNWGILGQLATYADEEDLPIMLVGENNGSGDWTGGNAGNSIIIRVLYEEVDLA